MRYSERGVFSLYKYSYFNRLTCCKELEDYLEGRAYRHTYYFHYTKAKTVKSILEKRSLWVTSITGFNDENDKNQFSKEHKNQYYVFCFSVGINENIPMWYLYSGVDGKGARISLTKNTVKKLIESSEYYLYELDSKGEIVNINNPVKKLVENEDFTREFRDVLYHEKGLKTMECQLKYGTMTNYRITDKELQKYCNKHKGFIKYLPWYYEKETRLVVRLSNNIVKELKDTSKYVIVLKFNDKLLRHMKILL